MSSQFNSKGKANPIGVGLSYTHGIEALMNECCCFWLINEITLAQRLTVIKQHSMLQQIQFWTLNVNEDRSARLVCEWDTGKPVWAVDIHFTDFPHKKVRVWVTKVYPSDDINHWRWFAMLPDEY